MTSFTEVSNNRRAATPTTCGYTVTYTVMWRDFYGSIIPLSQAPFIVWNPVNFRYEVYSNDPLDINNTRQFYKLELTGSISTTDMNPPFSKTSTVNLVVENGCLLDTMTIVTPITDYTYYINENTELNAWAFGTVPKPKDMKWYPQWT